MTPFTGRSIDPPSPRQSLVFGGINVATPAEAKGGKSVKDGTLYDEPKKEWLKWAPAISIGREAR